MTRLSLTLVALLLVAPVTVGAQQAEPADRFVLGGEFGTFSEGNWVFGTESPRPPASARLYARPSLSLYGLYTVSATLILTTEDRTFQGDVRQSLNQYSVTPDWGWGRATLGDFTDSYSPLTFNGVMVRGASLTLMRNTLEVGLFGGRSQQAAAGGVIRGRYSRTLAGGRIGIGDVDRFSLGLVVVGARDDVGSLGPPADTLELLPAPDTTFVEDTLRVGVENQFAVTPQANLIAALGGTAVLFGDHLHVRAEIAGGGHTRDLRSQEIDDADVLDRIPRFARALFTPRTSSVADHAHTVEARLTGIGPFTTTLGYRYIGPGYVSLGAASLYSDLREVSVRTSLRLRRVQASLDLGRQHDNLAGQKLYTTTRHRAALSASYLVRPGWTATARLHRAGLGNEAPEPELWVDYTSWQAGLRNGLTFSRDRLFRAVALDYSFRTTGDENPLRTTSASWSHAVNTSVQLAPRRGLSITPTVGLVRSRFGVSDWETRTTYGVGSQVTTLEGRWVTSLDLGRSQHQQTAALQSNLTSRFQVTQQDALVLGVRAADYDNVIDPELSFRELSASLRWAHRF